MKSLIWDDGQRKSKNQIILSIMFLILSFVIGLLAWLSYMLHVGDIAAILPYPYSSVPLQDISPTYISIIDSVKDASPAAVRKYASQHGIHVVELRDNVKTLFQNRVFGSESVGVNEKGDLLLLDKFGFLHTATSSPTGFTLSNSSLYVGPGRPLGFHVYDDETLIVCDSVKGLIQVDIAPRLDSGDGDRIRILSNAVSSKDIINYANDLDISSDKNKIYFTSSTSVGVVSYDDVNHYYDTMRSYILTWLAGDASGRVLVYDIHTHQTRVVMDGLYYANGIMVAPDESYVLVVETVGLRVLKVYLTGERRGQHDVFIDALPGFPDGISLSADGESALISIVAPLTPFFKLAKGRLVRWLLAWALAGPAKGIFSGLIKHFGCVMRVSLTSGKVLEILLDDSGKTLATVSATTEVNTGHGKRLYFGNLGGNSVALYDY